MTQDRLTKLEEDMNELKRSLERIEEALVGNRLAETKGLSGRLAELEKFMNEFNKKKFYYAGYASAIVFIIGFIVAIIKLMGPVVDFFERVIK